jgi:hypothetical protein
MKEQQLRKRNFISLTLEGTFFLTALAFLDANAVVPVFIDTFTGSLQLAGLATTLRTALSMLTQLLSGPYVPKIKNVPAYILWIMFLFRPLPFIMVPVLLGNLNPFLTVGIFLAIYGLFWASDGLVVIPWSDLLGRTIPANKRGKLMGYQQVTGGIAALGAGFLIKMILAHPNLENLVKYAIIFSGAGVSLMISSIMMSFARDLPRKLSKEKVSFKRYFSQMPHYQQSTASRGGSTRSSQEEGDIYWLARIIEAEAGGEPYLGKLAVGNVIMNRVQSKQFPDTVYKVIFEYYQGIPQFSPVADGTIHNTPSADSMKAARESYYGTKKPVGNALYFFNPAKAAGTWIVKNRSYVTTIGGHAFYA